MWFADGIHTVKYELIHDYAATNEMENMSDVRILMAGNSLIEFNFVIRIQ